jgi:hypothetical protein
MPDMNRAQHMAWAKQRALEAMENGTPQMALDSLISDMTKHPETDNPFRLQFAQEEGARVLQTESAQLMRAFIEGFR